MSAEGANGSACLDIPQFERIINKIKIILSLWKYCIFIYTLGFVAGRGASMNGFPNRVWEPEKAQSWSVGLQMWCGCKQEK